MNLTLIKKTKLQDFLIISIKYCNFVLMPPCWNQVDKFDFNKNVNEYNSLIKVFVDIFLIIYIN